MKQKITLPPLSMVHCPLSILFAAALFLAACDSNLPEASGGDMAIAFTVAPPPGYANNATTTRHTIDHADGKVAWDRGDVIHVQLVFRDETGNAIGITETLTLTCVDADAGSWMPGTVVYWPAGTATVSAIFAYMGTAQPGEAAKGQPLYRAITAFAAGATIELAFARNSHYHSCILLTNLQEGDEVTLVGNCWQARTLPKDFGTITTASISIAGHTLYADADGRAYIYAYLTGADPAKVKITREDNGSTVTVAADLDLELTSGRINTGYVYPIRISTEAKPGGVKPGDGM